ncbi:aminopyrimidine aminohydrolase [Roseibium aquae]|uniref:Aminopyrimidine aminohydrolase n=1 Tax=Roseibium aquae TaxID=1323746 RepID=A0A916TKY8_9HYPH|nr:thiaminase II [Roseibium aquae]GGB54398.1 aminopyrimidine aminohydrolase [Roseibium aquae]
MTLFDRLKADAPEVWTSYVDHPFVRKLGQGDLPLDAFKHYLVQDYLFLIQFARAYALAIYKSPDTGDMYQALEGVKAILDVELNLHLELCREWGLDRTAIETAPEMTQTMAYTRFVLEAGMAGDLLDLQVALAPCILGYAEIGRTLADRHGDGLHANPYRRWIDEYSGEAYTRVAAGFLAWIDQTADIYLTENRYPRLLKLFGKASALEADFWQMGLNYPGKR